MEPLNLSPENRAAIRMLVNKIAPHFLTECMEKDEEKRRQEEHEREILQQAKALKSQWPQTNVYGQQQTVTIATTANTIPYMGTGITTPHVYPTYTSTSATPPYLMVEEWKGQNTGTGFSNTTLTGIPSYPEPMGLTKSGSGWSK